MNFPAIERLAQLLNWRPRVREVVRTALQSVPPIDDDETTRTTPTAVLDEEYIESVARSLVWRPDIAEPYKYGQLKDGLRLETLRLSSRPYLVSLAQRTLDLDGAYECVFLDSTFESASEAIFRAGRYAEQCVTEFLAQDPDWQLGPEEHAPVACPVSEEHASAPQICFEHRFAFRGLPCHSCYLTFKVTGPHGEASFLAELARLVAEREELWAYFVDVSEVVRGARERRHLHLLDAAG